MNYLSIFLISLVAAAVGAPLIMNLLISLKSRQSIHKDAPENHQVKAGTPTMGGLIVPLGALVGLGAAGFSGDKGALPSVLLLLGFGLIGFVDDYVVPKMMAGKRGLGWKPKLLMQVAFGLGALYLSQPNLPPWAMATGLFFILFFTNAYNFSDGLDGLSGLLGVFLALGFFLLQPSAAPIALIAGFAVFLCYNAPPAKVFMGDVGALAIGSVFGLLFFQYTYVSSPDFVAYISNSRFGIGFVLSLVMIAELVPPPLQIFWVKVFKKRLFPYTPIHHAWEKAGWPETRVTIMFVMVQLACTMTAILAESARRA